MHIDRTHQITVSREPASATHPISSFGLLFVPTCRTLTRCASFGAGEAHDVGNVGFMGQVVDITTIFPQSQTLIVMSAVVVLANAMRIADEKGTNVVLNTEVNHLAGRFVSQITKAAFCPAALLIIRSLQLLPSARVLLAAGLLFRHLAQLLVSLPFDRADTTPGHDHRLPGVGRDSGQVNLAQVCGGVDVAWRSLGLRDFYAHMQLEAVIPDQTASTAVLWKIKRQDQRRATFAHWQHHPTTLFGDSLSRPLDRVEPFGSPGVFHPHLWMALTELARGLNIGKEGGNHHLNRLAVQGKLPPFGSFLQGITPRPCGMSKTCSFVRFHTHIPDPRCLHLSSFAALELLLRQIQLVDFYRLHGYNDNHE
jgi:hypothetical protein